MDSVQFLFGNYIAGSLIVPDLVVTYMPLNISPTADVDKLHTNLYPSCAVTRSQTRRELLNQTSVENIDSFIKWDLYYLFSQSETFDGEPIDFDSVSISSEHCKVVKSESPVETQSTYHE